MPIDSTILDEAGRLAYDDNLTIEEREQRLERLAAEKPTLLASVTGYMEMLSMLRAAKHESEKRRAECRFNGQASPVFLSWPTHGDALRRVEDCGALQEIEDALRRAYALTGPEHALKRLCPSSVVEKELKEEAWRKTVVWAPAGFKVRDSFDGWKEFPDADLRLAVEVEWPWQRVMGDLLKFWRAERLGQIDIGIEVLRGEWAFEYIVHHVYPLYRDLVPNLHVVFCALDAPDLRDQRFPESTRG